MRNIVIISLALLALILSNCGSNSSKGGLHSGFQPNDTGKAKIVFKEYEHNFGKVTEGEKILMFLLFRTKGL